MRKVKDKKKALRKARRTERKRLKRRLYIKLNFKRYNSRKAIFQQSIPPLNFSFISNTKNVWSYLLGVKNIFKEGYSVDFDLSPLDKLSFDALCLLKACLRDKNFKRKGTFSGNAPKKQDLRNLFLRSRFLDKMTHSYKVDRFDGEMINHRKSKKVVPGIARVVTEKICSNS